MSKAKLQQIVSQAHHVEAQTQGSKESLAALIRRDRVYSHIPKGEITWGFYLLCQNGERHSVPFHVIRRYSWSHGSMTVFCMGYKVHIEGTNLDTIGECINNQTLQHVSEQQSRHGIMRVGDQTATTVTRIWIED